YRAPARPARRAAGHTHPAIANCTKSVRHNHKNNGPHNHKYSCRGQRRAAPRHTAPRRATSPRRYSGHTHPAIANCTKSVRHNHKSKGSHNHKYSCRGQRRAAPRHTAPRRATTGNRWTHAHPAIPRCTKSIRHTHKYGNRNHSHAYGCRGGAKRPAPRRTAPAQNTNRVDIPALQRKLKAKGYYKGPINGVVNPATRSALHRYQQNR
ncbi:MAG: peptidoglycan-binding protein, partial [Thiotrichaceae bacterium]|nr:peptidoglycan-binding protein [Thiotrichaceae bacterium]